MQNEAEGKPLVVRGPVLVPFGWLVALVTIAISGMGLAFTIAIWVATISIRSQATMVQVEEIKKENAMEKDTRVALGSRVIRIETILSMVYPKQAEEARRIASEKGN